MSWNTPTVATKYYFAKDFQNQKDNLCYNVATVKIKKIRRSRKINLCYNVAATKIKKIDLMIFLMSYPGRSDGPCR